MRRNGVRTWVILLACCFLLAGTVILNNTPVTEWKMDEKTHWKETFGGRVVLRSEHGFSGTYCTVCGLGIYLREDGSKELQVINEAGYVVRMQKFDKNGALLYEEAYEHTLDENGNAVKEKIYKDGALQQEIFKKKEGTVYRVISHEENGDQLDVKFDDKGYVVEAQKKDKDGNFLFAETNDIQYLKDGGAASGKTYLDGRLTEEQFFDESGRVLRSISYNEDGSRVISWHNPDGSVNACSFVDAEGAVIHDSLYKYDNGQLVEETQSYPDGTKTISKFDANGNCVERVTLDDEGKMKMENPGS